MEYRGYTIEPFGANSYIVVYCGDEVVFDTIDEVKLFIDEVSK